MAYRADNEKVAKLKRAIIDGSSRRFKNQVIAPLYDNDENYTNMHFYILTDFQPGEEQEELIDVLSMCFEAGIDLSKSKAWKMYFRRMSTLFSTKINNLSDLAKVAFMEQEKKEEEIGDTSEWKLFDRVIS